MSKDFNISKGDANKRHWDTIVKNFPLTDNCLILTLKGTSVGHEKNLTDLSNAINRLGTVKGVIVGSVDSFDHIKTLDQKRMLEVGWIRQENVTIRLALHILFTRWKINIVVTWAKIKHYFAVKFNRKADNANDS